MTNPAHKIRIAALLTCHNRREKTLRCLESLFLQSTPIIEITAFVADDGSTDDTAGEIKKRHPEVIVIHGDGHLYWAGGMRAAFSVAHDYGQFDYYLWLNDDIVLDDGALEQALYWARLFLTSTAQPSVFVGTLRDASSGDPIYGGRRRSSKWRPLCFTLVTSAKEPALCETCNGNFLLIPSVVADHVGTIDRKFHHGCGDYDYGFRVNRAGFSLLALPGSVGTCSQNSTPDRNSICQSSFLQRWNRLTGPKLFPPRSWLTFTFRYGGPLWPIYFLSPYMQVVFPKFFKRLH